MTMRRWVDWVNVILGAWLIASPWLLSATAGEQSVAWNSWSVGVAVVTLAFLAMYKPAIWRDTVGILLGAWLMMSPWTLDIVSASAVINAFFIGLLIIAYAFWAMRIDVTVGNGVAR